MADVVSPVPANPAGATEAAPVKQVVPPKRLFGFIDDRYIAPIFITCILIAGQISFHILEDLRKTLLAIATSILIELILGRLFTGKIPHLASAYITGISVGILVRSPDIWPYALCSALAITSKYVIRYKGRHLWNPSNFAISAMLLLAPDSVASLSVQFGNSIWPMIVVWILGSVIIYRLKRFHICATYVVSFLVYAFLRAALAPHGAGASLWNTYLAEISPITGPMYQLYIFFMITDPKTTVRTKKGQMLVAFLVASAECVLRLFGNVHAPYLALTIVGPLAMFYEISRNTPKSSAAPVAKPA